MAVTFIATVTRENISGMHELVELGLGLGVRDYVMREVFYHPESEIVDHARMPGLLLAPGQFAAMRADLSASFSDVARFTFADEQVLEGTARKMIAEAPAPAT